MHDDALKELWRAQSIEPALSLPSAKQLATMKSRMVGMNRTLFWRDCRESIAAVFVMIVFGVYFFIFTTPLARLGSVLVILCSLFIIVYPTWRRRRIPKPAPDTSMMQSLEAELQKIDVEIALLRSVLWWYILPGTISVVIFMAGLRNGSIAFALMVVLFGIAFDAFLYWINQVACDKALLPLKRELESLLRLDENDPPPPKPRKYRAAQIVIIVFILLGLGVIWSEAAGDTPLRPPAFNDVGKFKDQDIAAIDAYLGEQVVRAKYPSLSVAIVRDGQIAYQRSFGFADKKSRTLATPETSYNVASVTKAFTASLAVILHARGVIDLDQPVVKYLPKGVSISTTPELGATITLRQLASHISGLPRGIPGPVQSVDDRYELEPQRLYDLLAKLKLVSNPGTAELYSNLGFGLLGHALERAAGKPFDQLLQEMICDPLQLQRTAINPPENLQVATGYSDGRLRLAEGYSYRERLAPSGGLISSVTDLSKFLSAQMTPGVLSSNMLEQLHTPAKLANGSNSGHALGWTVRTNQNIGRYLEKNGGRNNCSAWIGFSFDYRIGVAIITNCGDPSVDPIGRWLLDRSIPGGIMPFAK